MKADFEKYDRKIYDADPSRCEDCSTELPFEIRSNRRCLSCFKKEQKRKKDFSMEV